jgi:hypothetical protein
MNVDYCDYSQAVISEKFDTIDDFQYVFPVRMYSIFGIVTTVEMKFSEFFFSKGELKLTVVKPEGHPPVTVEVRSQDDTKFSITKDGKTEKQVGESYNSKVNNEIDIAAKYENVRWFAMITSVLTIAAIVMACWCMVFYVKRR